MYYCVDLKTVILQSYSISTILSGVVIIFLGKGNKKKVQTIKLYVTIEKTLFFKCILNTIYWSVIPGFAKYFNFYFHLNLF